MGLCLDRLHEWAMGLCLDRLHEWAMGLCLDRLHEWAMGLANYTKAKARTKAGHSVLFDYPMYSPE